MGSSFLEFIRQTGVFLLCTQCLVHFCAGKSYEKYVRLLVGMMVLAQFITPLQSLLLGVSQEELAEEIRSFTQKLEESAQAEWYPDRSEDRGVSVREVEQEIAQRLLPKAREYGLTIAGVRLEGESILIALEGSRTQEGQAKEIGVIEVKAGQEKTDISSPPSGLLQEFSILLGVHQDCLKIEWEGG